MNSRKNVIALDLLVHSGFLVWAVMAYIYFQERIYADAGFFVAKVIHYESFWVELNRYARVFSQWLPLLAIKSGASLKTVLILFSLCPVIFFYSIFLISRYWLKNHQVGWMLLSMCTIGISFGFATQGFELYYCAALLLILHVVLQRNPWSLKTGLLLAAITIFIVVNYQLTIVLLMGVLLINYFINKRVSIKTIFALIGLSLAAIWVKSLLVDHSYESNKAAYVINNLVEWNYDLDYVKKLFFFLLKHYIELLVVILFTTFYYSGQKRWLWLIGYWSFLFVGIIIAILTFPKLDHTRYQEQCYFFLIYIACFPMVMDIMSSMKGNTKVLFHVLLFGLIIYRFSAINSSMQIFTKRVDFMHRLINYGQKTEGNKFILNEENARTIVVYPFFSFAMETLLISGLYPSQKSVSIILDSYITHGDNKKQLQNENLYISTKRSFYNRADSLFNHNSVNKRYFDFPPGKYYRLNGNVPPNTSLDFGKNTIKLKAVTIEKLKASESGDIKITITNKSHIPLNSEQIRIGYQWLKVGEIFPMEWKGYLNPLEVDLLPSSQYEQTIRIHMPAKTGNYDLKIITFLNIKEIPHVINNTALQVTVE